MHNEEGTAVLTVLQGLRVGVLEVSSSKQIVYGSDLHRTQGISEKSLVNSDVFTIC